MKIHIEIPMDKKEGLERLKAKEGRSFNWLVNKALENYLNIKKAGKSGSDKK